MCIVTNAKRCLLSLFIFILLIGMSELVSATDNANKYDIPLSELNKVKKKSGKISKKKNEGSKKKEKESSHEPATKISSSPVMEEIQITKETARNTIATVSEVSKTPASPLENIKIHHTPFSFIIPAKRTIINAVISSSSEIKEVNCILRTFEGGSQTLKMEKVTGSFFTYSATLPGVPTTGNPLRYSIVAVDNFGNVSNSNEYSTPVESYPLTPSWQIEDVRTVPK